MKAKFFLMIIALCIIINPIIVKADSQYDIKDEHIHKIDNDFAIDDSKIDGQRFKIDFKLDNDGSGNDTEDKKVSCEWYEFWEWTDRDGECQIESYDTIYDKKTESTIVDWSMFKLQKKNKDWETPLIKDYNIYESKDMLSKIIEYEDNSTLNVTYIIYEDKVKWLLNITAGDDSEYRLKFRVKSKEIKDYGNKQVGIGTLLYDWNDIKPYITSYKIEDNIFEQYTSIGSLKKGQNIEIDPIITTDTTVNNPSYSNTMRDSSGNHWYVTKNTSHRLIYSDISGTWALNSTDNTNVSSTGGTASDIDSNDVIHIADTTGGTSSSYYANFSIDTGIWNVSGTPFEGTNLRLKVDLDDNIWVLANDYNTDEPEMYKFNSSGWNEWELNGNMGRDTRARGLAVSENYVLNQYQHNGGSTDILYFRVFNKTSDSLLAQGVDVDGDDITVCDAITVDYDLDYIIQCHLELDGTNYQLKCRNWNGTTMSSEDSWNLHDLDSLPFNESKDIYFGRLSTNTYLFLVNNTNYTYAIPMNDTNFSDSSADFDFDSYIGMFDNTDTADLPLQITHTNDTTMGIGYTLEGSSNIDFTEFPSGLSVRVFDEDTGSTLTNWSITVTDELSNTYSESYIDSFYNSSISGNVTIHIEKDGYAERYYYANNLGYYDLDAYLLNYTDSQLTTFTIVDNTDYPIEDANITIERLIDGNWTTVAQRITGVTGLSSFYLDPDISYRVTISAEGYATYSFIDILTDTQYKITLSTAFSSWASVFTGIANYRLTPAYPTYRVNQEVNNTFTIASPDGWLSEFGMNVTSWNGTVLYSNTSNTTTGGQLAFNKNWTASDCNFTTGCNFTVLAHFTTNNSSSYQSTKLYYITNTTSGAYSLVSIYNNITGLGTNKSWYMMLFVLIISAFIGSWSAYRYGSIVGGITAEMILGIAVALGFFDLTIYIINLIVLGAIIFILSRTE